MSNRLKCEHQDQGELKPYGQSVADINTNGGALANQNIPGRQNLVSGEQPSFRDASYQD